MLEAVGCIARTHDFGLAGLACLFGILSGLILARFFIGRRSQEGLRFRALANAPIEGIVLEQHGRIRDVNPALCAMADVHAGALVGRKLTTLIRGLSMTVSDPPGEYDLILADGGSRAVEVLWRDGTEPGSHVVAVRDLSVETAAQHQIRRLVQFDPLTGLGNRELFESQLQKVLALSDRATVGVAVLSIQLDRFDLVHEVFGEQTSDQIILLAARRLRDCVRNTDTVARLGPDAFAILQPLADKPSDAAVLAERIVAEMALPFEPSGQPITLSASVGVALYPDDGTTAAEMIDSAALALGRAQRDGRGTWRYVDPATDAALRDRRSLEQDLREALRDGRLSIVYQPFFRTETMEIIGFEALPRWDHPERGTISSAEFFAVAEACGLIMPIGRWILAAACAETVALPHPATLAVNLSPAQFLLPGIVDIVSEVLRDTGLPAHRLELEITESTLMEDAEDALHVLSGLKALGIRIAVDEFGAGYCSLGNLRRFRFDKIKIDKSFICDIDNPDSGAEAIVQAIIAMAASLGLEVAADGVATARHLALLKTLHCGFVQGYLLGRPGPAGFSARLAEEQARLMNETVKPLAAR
nr:bifunctional diguanylate cyclase/phosphodiesterase [uncultured Rhodopila sp.]